jgi:hypothetical protein
LQVPRERGDPLAVRHGEQGTHPGILPSLGDGPRWRRQAGRSGRMGS